MVEYGVIVLLIVLVVVGLVAFLGEAVLDIFTDLAGRF
jgi:Flp pilus assembly pilin Flp